MLLFEPWNSLAPKISTLEISNSLNSILAGSVNAIFSLSLWNLCQKAWKSDSPLHLVKSFVDLGADEKTILSPDGGLWNTPGLELSFLFFEIAFTVEIAASWSFSLFFVQAIN